MSPLRKTGIARLAMAVALLLAACKEKPRPPSPEAHLFTVRGQVVQLPDAHHPGRQFMIHHEAVPGFVDETGAVVGMGSMTMYFPTAKGLSLDSLQPGDKIRFVLSVDWPKDQVEITGITKLPADTPLHFGADSASADPAPSDSAAGNPG